MKTVSPCPLCKKRVGDSHQRRGHSPQEPQSLYMIMPTRSDHLVLTAKLQRETVRIILDSRANRSYTSLRLENKLARYQREKDEPYLLTIADEKPVDHKNGQIRNELQNIQLIIGQHTKRISLDIVNIKYDIILSMLWLRIHNLTVNQQTRILKFSNYSYETNKRDGSSPKMPSIKAIQVRPQERILASTSIELPSEYQDFENLFKEKKGEAALPKYKPQDHKILIENGKTPNHYRGLIPLSKKEKDFLKDYIEKHLAKEFIQPSKSSIAHGILFAPKKDGSLRPYIDYRKLNAIIKKNRYPLPRIDKLQDRLISAKWFTAIDIRDAYYQIRMKEGEEWKTAFRTRWGHYEYQVMPFSLTNAPASFQELINDTLREYLNTFVLAYLDDILIFSTDYKQHIQHIQIVLQKLREKDLPVKLTKYEFHKHSIGFLGYIVSDQGLKPDPKKVNSVKEQPTPRNVKDVQAFLGIINYYRKFIERFSQIAQPLTALTRKDVTFVQGHNYKEAFKKLVHRLTITPILAIFDPEREAILKTNASDYAVGACLTQKGDNDKMRTVAFYSHKITGPKLNYDIHDKELLVVVEALRKWRVYLKGTKYLIQIYTDHKNLLY